jgi:hypothetical protein
MLKYAFLLYVSLKHNTAFHFFPLQIIHLKLEL